MASESIREYIPTHPAHFVVEFKHGNYSSSLIAQKDFAKGERIVFLEGLTQGSKAYSSVQCGPNADDHVELNSDLLYEWHVRALRPIHRGDTLTFFYPSTEWDMAQPFDCLCGASACLRTIRGAAHLTADQLLARGYVSPWILASVTTRNGPPSSPITAEL